VSSLNVIVEIHVVIVQLYCCKLLLYNKHCVITAVLKESFLCVVLPNDRSVSPGLLVFCDSSLVWINKIVSYYAFTVMSDICW
jgi:hypothetical protein